MDDNGTQQMQQYANQFNVARPTPSPGLQTTGYMTHYQPYNPNYQQRCPSCGYCPTCGRGNQPYYYNGANYVGAAGANGYTVSLNTLLQNTGSLPIPVNAPMPTNDRQVG